ncbi:MAG: hypothetical protein HZB50_03350 [Chloroflexi bacterium]|nr:hypothetical protein [Chloroflexota bacterium]
MRQLLRNQIFQLLLALFIGLGLGLAYSWRVSPVTYVDANPAILRADFKDQYRVVIAASYASTHNLERARARLQLLGDTDMVSELSAQAQRMVARGELLEHIKPVAQLATDLQNGVASLPPTQIPSTIVSYVSTPFTNNNNLPFTLTPVTEIPTEELSATETQSTPEDKPLKSTPTTTFKQTALVPVTASTFVPRPTFTPIPLPGAPFILVGQDQVCKSGTQPGLLQFILTDRYHKQIAGIEIIITSLQGEDHSFTGFKPELGNGYADFVMQADTVYSIRVAGGAFVPDISAPMCKDSNGASYLGGLLLTFQQP